MILGIAGMTLGTVLGIIVGIGHITHGDGLTDGIQAGMVAGTLVGIPTMDGTITTMDGATQDITTIGTVQDIKVMEAIMVIMDVVQAMAAVY